MARPRVLDEKKKGEIIALISTGVSMADAARYVGCDRKTIRREREVNEEFDDQIRRAEMSAEFKPLHAIRKAASKHWRAAAWLIERQDKQKAARRKARAKAAGEVSMSLEQFARLTVQVKKVALSGVAFPEWEADLAQQLDEVFVKFAPTLAVPQVQEPLAAKPEPLEAETEAEETAQEATESTAPSESPRFEKVSPGILEKLPDYVRPTKKRSWRESAKMLEQMRPNRYGPSVEPAFDPAAAMKALRDDLISVLARQHKERLAAAEKTCGEQREEVKCSDEQEESGNAEVCEKAEDEVA